MTIRSKNIGSSAIQPRHFDGTLIRGFIPFDVQDARIVGSTSGESWGSATTSAGFVSSATAPRYTTISTAVRIAVLDWSSASLVPVQWGTVLPPDYSTLSSGVLHILAGRAAAASSDTSPIWTANFFGSTGASASVTAAVTAASSVLTEYTLAIPAGANVGYPSVLTFTLNPTSSADNPKLAGLWLEYTRTSTSISTAY